MAKQEQSQEQSGADEQATEVPTATRLPVVGDGVQYIALLSVEHEGRTLMRVTSCAALVEQIHTPENPEGSVALTYFHRGLPAFVAEAPYGENPGCWRWPQ